MNLPCNHAVHLTLVQASVKPYIERMLLKKSHSFKFQAEIDELGELRQIC